MKVQQNTDVQMSNVQNQDYFSKNNAETPKGKGKEKERMERRKDKPFLAVQFRIFLSSSEYLLSELSSQKWFFLVLQ